MVDFRERKKWSRWRSKAEEAPKYWNISVGFIKGNSEEKLSLKVSMEIRETGDEEGDDGVDKGNERENRPKGVLRISF